MTKLTPLSLALSVAGLGFLTTQFAHATTSPAPGNPGAADNGAVVWCWGDGSSYTPVSGYSADTAPAGLTSNPADTIDGWKANPILTNGVLGRTAETGTPAAPVDPNDRYAIQINYWNSVTSTSTGSIGYSTGNSCMAFSYDTGYPNVGQFTITYPATPPVPRSNEQDWATANPSAYPWYGKAPYTDGPIQGGPYGYVSTFKGCSWDTNSCTAGSAVLTAANPNPPTSTNWNIFPRKLSAVTSIPSTWRIELNNTYGNPKDGTQVWDASYDIWFDKTGQTGHGQAPYGDARGQNDGLEIMVWMDSGHSYVDAPGGPTPDATGYAQPSGARREQVLINNIVYDVWTARLNNPYYGYPSDAGSTVIGAGAEPSDCTVLPVHGGTTTCGTEWNVVSFVATKYNGVDYRGQSMAMDTKVFTDYILGINDGLWQQVSPAFTTYSGNRAGTSATTIGVLQCPTSAMNTQSVNPVSSPSPCLDQNWFLTSVQAGFEPWIGGNGLQSDSFQAHALITSTAVQSGLTSDDGNPVVNWVNPFEVVYAGCTTYSTSNTASFLISGINSETGLPQTYPADNVYQDMDGQLPGTNLFQFTVNGGEPLLYPIHGTATITFHSNCGPDATVTVYVDPSGQVFYSDGVTPVQGATVTLLYSPSGGASGPFVAVPNHNFGLASAVMQPDDNTLNPMPSSKYGAYGWNVAPGYYEVNANKSGCGTVTSPIQHVTTTPVTNLFLNLPCAPPTPPTLVTASRPRRPATLTATAVSSSQINLRWSAVPVPLNATAVTYTVYEVSPAPGVIASGIGLTSYQVTGLRSDTTYTFAVWAVDSGGASPWSPWASARTLPSPGHCHVVYTVANAIPGVYNGLTVHINIQNTGTTPIYPWTLGWTFPGNQQISYAWNVNWAQHGQAVSMASIASWESIPPGGTLAGAVGFNGQYTGANTSPTAFTLNGLPCD